MGSRSAVGLFLLYRSGYFEVTGPVSKYKLSTDKVLQIEPKEDLKDRIKISPDFAEAFMLTFSVGKPQSSLALL